MQVLQADIENQIRARPDSSDSDSDSDSGPSIGSPDSSRGSYIRRRRRLKISEDKKRVKKIRLFLKGFGKKELQSD